MQNRPSHTVELALHSNESVYFWGVSMLACAAYAWVWRDFLMSPFLFGDYGLSIPALLDYFFWAHQNGLLIQWFTPGFCGGIPVFPEPQSTQYSVLTLLSYFLGPTTGVKTSFVLHAWIGFVGAYLLCRRSFKLRIDTSAIAAILFMFNGFYAYRIVVSHLFFGLMLTPALAWFLLEACASRRWWSAVTNAIGAALLFAAYIYSGGLGMVVPFCAGVTLLLALHFATQEISPSFSFVARAAGVFIIVAYLLSAPKLVAANSFLDHFPRDSYRLPGFASWVFLLKSMWTILFLSPADSSASIFAGLSNAQWLLERHEWEFGVTLAPLILILIPLKRVASHTLSIRISKLPYWVLVAVLLLMPMVLNYYTPEWNRVLKQIPVLKSSSNLVRYFWVWVVFLCFCPVVFFDRCSNLSTVGRLATAGLCVFLVILTFNTQDKDYYQLGSTYDPGTVELAYAQVSNGHAKPYIHSLGVLSDDQGRMIAPADRNKTLAQGISQLLCYQPIFGYRLEKFPFGSIYPGDPFAESAPDRLNFKNPACMTYPEANGCVLGDEFHLDQSESLARFLKYQPYNFELSAQQLRANMMAIGMFVLILMFLGAVLIHSMLKRSSTPPISH